MDEFFVAILRSSAGFYCETKQQQAETDETDASHSFECGRDSMGVEEFPKGLTEFATQLSVEIGKAGEGYDDRHAVAEKQIDGIDQFERGRVVK